MEGHYNGGELYSKINGLMVLLVTDLVNSFKFAINVEILCITLLYDKVLMIIQAIGVSKAMMIPAYLQGALEWIFTDQESSKTDDALQCSTCHSSVNEYHRLWDLYLCLRCFAK